jgi:hypothetical protein
MLAMIEECQDMIHKDMRPSDAFPAPLRKEHLLWMCDQLFDHVDGWTAAKMNRWVGFVQCALIANGTINLTQAKAMFEGAKNAFGEPDQDLLDHLDPANNFEMEFGGEG